MDRIGAGARVFVVLSQKYLRSPFCMYELHQIWCYSRRDRADFLKRIRVYTLPDTQATSPTERLLHAAYWKAQYDQPAALIKEHGVDIVGEQDLIKIKLTGEFSRNTSDILSTMFGIVQPRSFEALVEYGFDDLLT